MSNAVTTMQGEAVRLALAACVGKGAEARDIVELAADVVGEVFRLRGTMADAEANARQAAELSERRLSLMNQLGRTLDVSVRREDALRAEVARLTAEVERLKEQRNALGSALSSLSDERGVWFDVCPSCGAGLECDGSEPTCEDGQCSSHHCEPGCVLTKAMGACR